MKLTKTEQFNIIMEEFNKRPDKTLDTYDEVLLERLDTKVPKTVQRIIEEFMLKHQSIVEVPGRRRKTYKLATPLDLFTENTYHNIGMAKSLGYGKVELKLDGIEDLNSYLKSFELTMTDQVLDWKESSQLKELLTMATEQNNAGDSALKYMELEEFSKNKVGTKYYLKKYTELEFIKETTLNSLLSQSDLDELKVEKERYAQEQKDKALKQQEEERFQDELDNLNYENIHIVENFIKKYSKHEKIDEVRAKQDEIKKSMELDKFSRANENFKSAYDALMKKKSNPKQYKKELDKFVKKWEAHKNNKSSPYILERIEKLKSPI